MGCGPWWQRGTGLWGRWTWSRVWGSDREEASPGRMSGASRLGEREKVLYEPTSTQCRLETVAPGCKAPHLEGWGGIVRAGEVVFVASILPSFCQYWNAERGKGQDKTKGG